MLLGSNWSRVRRRGLACRKGDRNLRSSLGLRLPRRRGKKPGKPLWKKKSFLLRNSTSKSAVNWPRERPGESKTPKLLVNSARTNKNTRKTGRIVKRRKKCFSRR